MLKLKVIFVRSLSIMFLIAFILLLNTDIFAQEFSESRPRKQSMATNNKQEENNDEDKPLVESTSDVIKSVKVIYVRSRSRYVHAEELEEELMKQPMISRWGLVVTREEMKADLIIEVTRKKWSRKYTLSAVDPKTNSVLFAVKAHNTWLSNLHHKLAEKFVERMKEAGR